MRTKEEKNSQISYVYYSYEEWGRGYIGVRLCPANHTPETDPYLGSFTDKTFKPTAKIIIETFESNEDAREAETKLHDFFDVDINPHFANLCQQRSHGLVNKTGTSFIAGKKKYTNGKRTILLSKDEVIPKGFKPGIAEKYKINVSLAQRGKKQHDKTKEKISEAVKGEKNPCYNKKIYNNGEINRFFNPELDIIPAGFVPGISEESIERRKEAQSGEKSWNKGRKVYNNEIMAITTRDDEEIPDGFVRGLLPSTNKKIREARKKKKGLHSTEE